MQVASWLGIASGIYRKQRVRSIGLAHSSRAELSRFSYDLHRSLAEEYDGATKWGYRALDTYVCCLSSVGGLTLTVTEHHGRPIQASSAIPRSVDQPGDRGHTARQHFWHCAMHA